MTMTTLDRSSRLAATIRLDMAVVVRSANSSFLPSWSASAPQIPNGQSDSRPSKPMTRMGADPRALSFQNRARSSGKRASNPRAIMLCVLPPPIDWDSMNVAAWLLEPFRRSKAMLTSIFMPLVTKFSSKNAAATSCAYLPSNRSLSCNTTSRRFWSKVLLRGVHTSKRILVDFSKCVCILKNPLYIHFSS